MRVLVLDSGPTSSYHVMRNLARAGHEVHLASYEPTVFFQSKYCSRALTAPAPSDRAAYGQFLVDTVRANGYGVLFFCGDDEAQLVWELRHELEPHVRCFLPDERWKDIAFDKRHAERYVAGLGLPIPASVQPDSSDDIAAIERRLSYPIVVKGGSGSAGSQVRFAEDRPHLVAGIAEVAKLAGNESVPIAQEYIPGPVHVVHALFDRGRPIALCSHRKDRDFPVGRGVTSAGTTGRHRELDESALHILSSMDWHGLAKLDFKFDQRDRRFKFLELDPRVSASIDITRAAGVDQAALLCELAAGRPTQPQLEYQENVCYRWVYPRDGMRLLAQPWRIPGWLLGALRPNTHCDLDFDDLRYTTRALRALLWHFKTQLKTGAVWRQSRELEQIERSAQRQLMRGSMRLPRGLAITAT